MENLRIRFMIRIEQMSLWMLIGTIVSPEQFFENAQFLFIHVKFQILQNYT